MKPSKKIMPIAALFASCLALSYPPIAAAEEIDSSIAACLKAWGVHPFGKAPQFKTMGTSVKVFGIGSEVADTQPTSTPALVLINPSFNLVGVSTIELLNPNGWYCMRTTVTIMGNVHLRAHCKAQLALTSAGVTATGNNVENVNIKNVTVTAIGSFSVERPCG
ncbi:MAG: hypothetical protein A3G25_12265 [Betaproteobacteria bacterium RIFCSPLOWO2_12_FULL_63_13]|nr:MAG: hypothetical protein A3H32_15745 [Betaproteobacteria bacterium RIFCSPLOWO2_02_FULL_63_19]OGA44313.1 MAG: hypothetical protein A3G25_12265 [Betaproteobacteria bacterium RIFCSPLOWO2_12_FULL_63_13]